MVIPLLLLSAALQDPALEWIDRVGHDVVQAKGPLNARPLHHALTVGLLSSYENNVNLEDGDEDAETVLMAFLGVRVDYTERQVEAAVDFLGDFKEYIPDHEFSDEEERAYGRIRFLGPKLSLEAAEIFQHVSDPVDAVFADRVARFVSQTIGHGRLEASGAFALEADVDAGLVRFQEKEFDNGDNWNLRAGLGAAARLSSTLEAVARAGMLLIDYRYRTGAPPDVDGLYAHAGVRGDLLPQLSVTAVLGAARASSEDFDTGADGKDGEAGEAALHLRWQATPTLTLYGDYSRQMTFGAGIEPFQVVNRGVLLAEFEATQEVRLRGRAQLDHADGALGLEREYATLGASVQWQSHPQVFFDAGVLYRRGDTSGAPADADYDDAVVHLGVVLTN
jgi:hypothetical protein